MVNTTEAYQRERRSITDLGERQYTVIIKYQREEIYNRPG
jgi:hypothetical protein